jgi:hypothetical protein
MIFSQWQPDGGFVYYRSSKTRHPIGDDLPAAPMPRPTQLGVPAQDAGQPLPSDAVRVGEGSQPRGVMAPMARGVAGGLGQSQTKLSTADTVVVLFLIGVFAVAAMASRGDTKSWRG